MSWSAASPTPIERKQIAHVEAQPQTNPEGVDDAYGEHFKAAKKAAADLAKVVGRDDDLVTVSMSGHANPDHAPTPGWGDEFITITVYAKPKAPQPTDAA